LEKSYPGAAKSLREGLDETLTVIESALSIVRDVSGNVKYWRNGKMAVRWAASGFIIAERRFKRIKGYRYWSMPYREVSFLLTSRWGVV
jgi:hypothetical protein